MMADITQGLLGLSLGLVGVVAIWRHWVASERALENKQYQVRLAEQEGVLQARDQELLEYRSDKEHKREQIARLETELAVQDNQLSTYQKAEVAERDKQQQQLKSQSLQHREREQQLEQSLQELQKQNTSLGIQLAQLNTVRESERKQNAEKIALLEDARKQFGDQFKNLANEILKDNSRQFKTQSEEQLAQLLNPLRTEIGQFKSKTEEIQLHNVQQNASLLKQLDVMRLEATNLSQEAHQLSTALRGSTKQQGNWGEMILDTVLERSGLREGEHYQRQKRITNEGEFLIPDVVVKLPQNRHLVIDAKVSLNAYSRYINAEQEAERSVFLKEHLHAISEHLKGLSGKNYAHLAGLNTPEMVIMFMPIESAFAEAMRADPELIHEAIKRKIMIATPTTLLSSMNIIAQLWRHEDQNRNTAELYRAAGNIYEKLRLFIESMDKLGGALSTAQKAYHRAKGQLHSGKGNLINQVKNLELLGVKPTKELPKDWVEQAKLETDYLPTVNEDGQVLDSDEDDSNDGGDDRAEQN